MVSIGNCLTSFFAGFVIFGIIGFMAHEFGMEVGEVAKQGRYKHKTRGFIYKQKNNSSLGAIIPNKPSSTTNREVVQ